MLKSSIVLILLAVVCGVGGQLALKIGMDQVGQIGSIGAAQLPRVAARVLSNPVVVTGLGFYIIGAALWVTVLSRVPLSFAYPLLALGYAITPMCAWILLGEAVPSLRWAGIVTICLGVILVSRS